MSGSRRVDTANNFWEEFISYLVSGEYT